MHSLEVSNCGNSLSCFPDCVFQSDRAAATRDVDLLFSTSISVEAKLVEEKEIKKKKKKRKE